MASMNRLLQRVLLKSPTCRYTVMCSGGSGVRECRRSISMASVHKHEKQDNQYLFNQQVEKILENITPVQQQEHATQPICTITVQNGHNGKTQCKDPTHNHSTHATPQQRPHTPTTTTTTTITTNTTTPSTTTQPMHDASSHTCEVAQVSSNSFYRRPLPDTLIAFSSPEGRKLFRGALEQGYMEGYFALAEQFVSQSDPAYCGPATLAMCLNALNIDPNRLWKGPWRWFAEDMLDCCTPLDVVKKRGITFTEFACLAKCNGANVVSFRGDECTLENFRKAIKDATSQPSLHMVVSYSRKVLGQTGQGHYSPVGGYHPEQDLALMLDVARFKYAPHWVPVETLWKSMRELDQDTQKPRGYYLLTRSKEHRPPAVCRVTSKTVWAAVASHLSSVVPPYTTTAVELVEKIIVQLPVEASQVLTTYPEELYGRLPREHEDMLKRFFREISSSEVCSIVKDVLAKMEDTPCHTQQYGAEILSVLLLACPTQLFGTLSPEVSVDLARLRSLEPFSKDVQTEILQIREQMFLALKSNCKKCAQETKK